MLLQLTPAPLGGMQPPASYLLLVGSNMSQFIVHRTRVMIPTAMLVRCCLFELDIPLVSLAGFHFPFCCFSGDLSAT
jgi:hypothetical protein